jgi:hypothetical protein
MEATDFRKHDDLADRMDRAVLRKFGQLVSLQNILDRAGRSAG